MNTTVSNNLPSLTNEGGLSAYLDQIKKFPMLAAEEEYMLAKNWKTTGNIKSAEKLVTSHLRLVAKIAMGYKGYGLPVNEMISEAKIEKEYDYERDGSDHYEEKFSILDEILDKNIKIERLKNSIEELGSYFYHIKLI